MSSTTTRVFYIKKFVSLKINENVGVMEYLNKFNEVNSQLVSVSIEFDEDLPTLLMLSGLPST